MRKYFGLASVIITLITLFILPSIDWKLGILGIIFGIILAIKAPKGILKYVSYVTIIICILLFVFLIVTGILMGGLVDIKNNKLP